MATYAVIDNNVVINVIVSDSKEDAEFVTGKFCIEYTTEPAEPGGTWDGNRFYPIKPGDEYIWDEINNCWKNPNLPIIEE